MVELTKTIILNLPIDSEIPNELFSFSPDENFLLLKIGTNVITDTKKSLIDINNQEHIDKYKSELTLIYEKEIQEYKNKIKNMEYENDISLKHKEKLYENMNLYYRENIIRFDKAFEEFKTANNHLQNELKIKNTEITELNNKLIQRISEEANKKNQSTIEIGNKGEFLFQDIANETFRDFPEYNSKHVGELGHVGDVHLFFKDFNILCDTKLHKSVVGKTHREQIKGDLQKNTMFKFAWLISYDSGICKYNQAPFVFDSIIHENGDKLYICYINNFSSIENKNELLRSVWYSCKTLYDDVIKKQNNDGELTKLKVFKDNTLKTLEIMIKTSREMNENIKMLQQTKQVLDDAIKSINNNNSILSIKDKYVKIVEEWWNSNIKDDINNNLTLNNIFKRFSKDIKNNEITIDDFKELIISILDNNKIIQPKNKNGCLKIKEKNFTVIE
jgi:hypothetical protein